MKSVHIPGGEEFRREGRKKKEGGGRRRQEEGLDQRNVRDDQEIYISTVVHFFTKNVFT